MKDYRQLIKELPPKTVVCAFGRFNPPNIGHELLVKSVKRLSEQKSAEHIIYASNIQDAKNPLEVSKKVQYLNSMFPKTQFSESSSLVESLKELGKKYKNIVLVTDADQIAEVKKLIVKEHLVGIEIVPAGDKNPDESKMLSMATKGLFEQFKKELPSSIRDIDGRRLMNDIRSGIGLEPVKEHINLVKDKLREQYFRGEIFNVGDIVESNGVNYTIVKRGSNHVLLKEESGNLVSKWIQDIKTVETGTEMNEDKKPISFLKFNQLSRMSNSQEQEKKEEDEANSAKANSHPQIKTTVGDDESSENRLEVGATLDGDDKQYRRRKVKYTIGEDYIAETYDEAIKHMEKATAAKEKDDMIGYHKHLSDYHEAMGNWHDSRGRSNTANHSYNKAEEAHKNMIHYMGMKEDTQLDEDQYTSEYKIKTWVDPVTGKTRTRKIRPHRIDFEASKEGGEPDDKDVKEAVDPDAKFSYSDWVKSGKQTTPKHFGKKGSGTELNTQIKKELEDKKKKQEAIDEAHKLGDKVVITKGSDAGKVGFVGEIRHGLSKTSPKTYTIDHSHDEKTGNKQSIQLKSTHFKKAPTAESSTIQNPPLDPFFKEDNTEDREAMMAQHDESEKDRELNISDQEIDVMVNSLTDDQICDDYDEDEVTVVDDESGEELPHHPEELKITESLMEVLSRSERMKAKFRLRKTQAKRERSTKIALRRFSDTKTINKRARRLAIKLMKQRMLRGRDISKISVGEKERIERAIAKRTTVVSRIALKLIPRIRGVEKARMSHKTFTKPTPNTF